MKQRRCSRDARRWAESLATLHKNMSPVFFGREGGRHACHKARGIGGMHNTTDASSSSQRCMRYAWCSSTGDRVSFSNGAALRPFSIRPDRSAARAQNGGSSVCRRRLREFCGENCGQRNCCTCRPVCPHPRSLAATCLHRLVRCAVLGSGARRVDKAPTAPTRRGKCSFSQKAVHVQQAGGLIMLVINDSDEQFIMTVVARGSQD